MLETQAVSEPGFVKTLERYLAETLHDKIHVTQLSSVRGLPAFLERTYKLHEARIVGRRCVFAVGREDVATPSDIAKHVGIVHANLHTLVAFAAPSLSAHNRSRLIQHGVAFVIPGNQLYIPELALDLREHFRALKTNDAEGLSPAAQAVLFHHLLGRGGRGSTPSLLAKQIGYSAMSIGRAFDDLVAIDLAETDRHGRERRIRFSSEGRALFDAAQKHLRTPVRALKFISGDIRGAPLKIAGESALAMLTELAPPRIKTRAVAASDWKSVVRQYALIETDRHAADYIVESWSYDPERLTDTDVVDRLSLYAQFKDHSDERVAAAAEQLLGSVSW